jgi:hypothetical protein
MKREGIMAWVMGGLLLLTTSVVYGDDISDSIEEGLEAYGEKAYDESVESLSYAIQLINQLRADLLKSYLPKPLTGWTAKEGKAQTGPSIVGGGFNQASREYTNQRKKIKIEISDATSPMMQGMVAMLSNPAYATADGGKWQKIKRQKAVVKYKDEKSSGEITMVIANKFLIKINGNRVDREDMVAYASEIDFKGLKSH